MQIKVTMNSAALTQILNAQIQTAEMTAQEMLNRTRNAQVMPFDTGTMQNEGVGIGSTVDNSKSRQGIISIVTDTPYARRLYYHPEYHFNTSKNANAQGEWWEPYLKGAKAKEPVQLFMQFYRRVLGRYVT